MIKKSKICCVLLLVLMCCKKPYNPPVISTTNSYLVVEGIINSGSDSTIIKLSKTVKLSDKTAINPLLGATVTVEGDKNSAYPLVDIYGRGDYSAAGLNLPATQKYRLKIITGNKQYVSDFMAVKQTPPIDSVNYVISGNTVNLYVSSHDAANSTHYYRWDFNETWVFHAKYASDFMLDANTSTIVPRPATNQIYRCFGDRVSSNILLFNTSKLSSDVVYEAPLTSIPVTSEKFEEKYSMLVTQYALTPDAFNFYQNLKQNTEDLGSIFDALPSQISGNIHNAADTTEPVIGYVSVCNTQTKRIFISRNIFPDDLVATYPYDCEQDSALYSDKTGFNDVQNALINPPVTFIPTSSIPSPGGGIAGFLYSSPQCVDCTLRGTTITPPFWQ